MTADVVPLPLWASDPVSRLFEGEGDSKSAPQPKLRGVKTRKLPRLDSNQEPSGNSQGVVIPLFGRLRRVS